MWVGAISLHPCKNVTVMIIPNHLILFENTVFLWTFVCWNMSMNGIELLTLISEELLVYLGIGDWLVDIDGDLESISNMLASGETSKETTVL